MKMRKGDLVIECTEHVKNVWVRYGFEELTEELTYQDMKRIAKENDINSYGMKKEELEEAIKPYI